MKPAVPVRSANKGFSLVELMFVVAVILLLAAMATPRYLQAQQKAYEAASVSFMKSVQTEQEAYRLTHGQYADNFFDLGLQVTGPVKPELPFAPELIQASALRMRLAGTPAGEMAFILMPAMMLDASLDALPQDPDHTFGNQKKGKGKGKKGGESMGSGGPDMGGSGSGGKRPGGGGQPGSGGGAQPPAGGGSGSGGGDQGSNPPTAPGQPPAKGGSGGSQPGGGGTGAPSLPGGGSGQALPRNVVMKHSHVFRISRPALNSFVVTVEPVRDRGDSRFFYMDQSGVIRWDVGKPATPTSPPL